MHMYLLHAACLLSMVTIPQEKQMQRKREKRSRGMILEMKVKRPSRPILFKQLFTERTKQVGTEAKFTTKKEKN